MSETLTLDDLAKKLGVPSDVLEQLRMLSGETKNIQAHMRILIYLEDFLRLYQFLITGAYGRALPRWAFDAMLGFVNLVSAIAQTHPLLRNELPMDSIKQVNDLHHDIRYLGNLIDAFKTGNIVGYGEEIASYRSFLEEHDYQNKYRTSNMHTLLDKLSQEYEQKILELWPKLYVVLYPLASQRTAPKSSAAMPTSEGEQRMNIAEVATTILMGAKPKKEE